MAILLIRMKDNLRPGHPAPETAARPGDIVSVLDDGADVGSKCIPPDWKIVQVPGVPRARLLHFENAEVEMVTGLDGVDEEKILKFRERKLDDTLLTTQEKQESRLSLTEQRCKDVVKMKPRSL